jgi:hypothetical protein
MHQLWYWRMKQIYELVLARHVENDVVCMVQDYSPAFLRNDKGIVQYQVVLFKPFADSNHVFCGVTLEAFRGALLQPSKLRINAQLLDLLAVF